MHYILIYFKAFLVMDINFIEFFSKAVKKSFRLYKGRFIDCQAEFSEKLIHDVRVSIRKFLSLNLLLNKISQSDYSDEIRQILKHQLKMLNLLRDTQVQIIFVRKLLPKYPILERFLAFLLYTENEAVNKIYKKLIKYDIEEIEGLVVFYRLDVKNKLTNNEEILQTIDNTLENYFQIIYELTSQVDKNNPETIHKLRLAFKKFRYTIEALEPIINVTKHDLKVLHSYQTVMGKIQDNCVIFKNLNSYIDNQIIIPKAKFDQVISEIIKQRELLIYSFMNRINIPINFWETKRTFLFKLTSKS